MGPPGRTEEVGPEEMWSGGYSVILKGQKCPLSKIEGRILKLVEIRRIQERS